jgi:O-glycosyl hydrolase
VLSGRCTRLVAGCAASCRRTLAASAVVVLVAAAHQADSASGAWRASTPLASHAMVYLDAPYSFKQTMFRESARLGASAIRVDLALSAVFAADGNEDWRQVDEVVALARRYRLRPVGIVLATPWFLAACPIT